MEELFTYFFEIYIKFDFNNPLSFSMVFSVDVENTTSAYAIWYDEEKKWCVGLHIELYLSYVFPGFNNSMIGPTVPRQSVRQCIIFAFGRVRFGGNDVDPTDSGYVWGIFTSIANGRWEPANGGFKIISADGNSIYFYGPKKYLTKTH